MVCSNKQDMITAIARHHHEATEAMASGRMAQMLYDMGERSAAVFCDKTAQQEIDTTGSDKTFADMVRMMLVESHLRQADFPYYMGQCLEPESLIGLLHRILTDEGTDLNEPWFLRTLYVTAMFQWAGDVSRKQDLYYGIHETWKSQIRRFLFTSAKLLALGVNEEVLFRVMAGDLEVLPEDEMRRRLFWMLRDCTDLEKAEINIRPGVTHFYGRMTNYIEPLIRMLLVSLSFEEYGRMRAENARIVPPSLCKTFPLSAVEDPYDGEPADLLWARILTFVLEQELV